MLTKIKKFFFPNYTIEELKAINKTQRLKKIKREKQQIDNLTKWIECDCKKAMQKGEKEFVVFCEIFNSFDHFTKEEAAFLVEQHLKSYGFTVTKTERKHNYPHLVIMRDECLVVSW